MAVNIFIFILLSISTISYFIPVENIQNKTNSEETPLLTFTDSTMYTLTSDSMNRIVDAKQVQRYKTKDVMYKGTITLKGDANKKTNENLIDTLYADFIIKREDNFKFIENVKFNRDDFLTLNTNELFYNAKTLIATNTVPFDGTYYNNYIKGEKLYLDRTKYFFKSKNTHFELEVEKK